jgi:hypothetical protein
MPSEISLTRHASRKKMFSALRPEADVSRPVWNVRSVTKTGRARHNAFQPQTAVWCPNVLSVAER